MEYSEVGQSAREICQATTLQSSSGTTRVASPVISMVISTAISGA